MYWTLYWIKMGLWIKVLDWKLAYFLVLGVQRVEMAVGLEHRICI